MLMQQIQPPGIGIGAIHLGKSPGSRVSFLLAMQRKLADEGWAEVP